MSNMLAPFQLLELNVISGQDLATVSNHMKSYAVAWVHPDRKLTTRVDQIGHNNPTWNDKFVFRVDDEFLYTDTSAVMIEIYALHWFRDIHVGTVRVLVGNLIPPHARPQQHHPPPGMRFLALQVRRPSGRPQGILNIGVALLSSSMRSMPLYTQMSSSAVGYRDLMGEEDPHLQHLHHNKTSSKNPQSITSKNPQSIASRNPRSISSKPELRRTKSDTSSMMASELRSRMVRSAKTNSKAASVINGSELDGPSSKQKKKKKDNKASSSNASSLIGTSDNMSPPGKKEKFDSEFRNPPNRTPKKKFSSFDSEVVDPSIKEKSGYFAEESSGADLRKTPMRTPKRKPIPKDYTESPYPFSKNREFTTPRRSNMELGTPMRSNFKGTPMKSNFKGTPMKSNFLATPMKSHLEFGTPMRSNLGRRPILTESELGPSPSEVAAQMAKERAIKCANDAESSIVSEWSLDDCSVEGLRSKLERWRTELPPLYDLGEFSSYNTSEVEAPTGGAVGTGGSGAGAGGAGGRSVKHKSAQPDKHNRRHTYGTDGLFSCFSNICGLECSIVCGSSGPEGGGKRKGNSGRARQSPSLANLKP